MKDLALRAAMWSLGKLRVKQVYVYVEREDKPAWMWAIGWM